MVLKSAFHFNRPDYAAALFNETLPNFHLYHTMICGFVSKDYFDDAIDFFHYCVKNTDSKLGVNVHSLIVKHGFDYDACVNTGLVGFYSKLECLDDVRKEFDEMPEWNVVSLAGVMSGYVGTRRFKEAVDLFRGSLEEGLKPDNYTLIRALSTCSQLGDLVAGEWIHKYMMDVDMGRNVFVNTALVDMYPKYGHMEKARVIFDGMHERDRENLGPDRYVIVGVLSTCARLGALELGERASSMMDRNEFLLNPVTGTALIDIDWYSLDLTIEHYGSMVDLLARVGLLNKAYSMILSILMKANSIVWEALLAGCRLHKNTQLAEYVLERLIKLELWNSGNYVLLSNIYSANQKWNESVNIRPIMHKQGIQKLRGCSWIQVDGIVHEFLIGDTYHAMSDDIYTKLVELAEALRAAGYVPTTEYVLFDIEDDENEHFWDILV
ncbi:hypothetical protein C2S52_010663 [Perilla frutescens var. hirtella]|nr:hypothetical protein C2S52_010663 [Perilla frutescens var. hirtella]